MFLCFIISRTLDEQKFNFEGLRRNPKVPRLRPQAVSDPSFRFASPLLLRVDLDNHFEFLIKKNIIRDTLSRLIIPAKI